MKTPVALSAGLLSLALLSGCIPALREPPPLPESRSEIDRPAVTVAEEIARAEELYATRRMNEVHQAIELWTGAAAQAEDQTGVTISLARAKIWLAGNYTDPQGRRDVATGAVHAAQWCRSLSPNDPECAYWLGAALGVQARERKGTALDALPRIVGLFTEAREGAPMIDRAGPDRALALLYLRAPGWPSGPGDPDLGLAHASMAVTLEPGYAPNVLALAEALESVERVGDSRAEYERAQLMAREALERGVPDAQEWVEEAEEGIRRHVE